MCSLCFYLGKCDGGRGGLLVSRWRTTLDGWITDSIYYSGNRRSACLAARLAQPYLLTAATCGCFRNRQIQLWSTSEPRFVASDQWLPFLLVTSDAASVRSFFLPLQWRESDAIRAQHRGRHIKSEHTARHRYNIYEHTKWWRRPLQLGISWSRSGVEPRSGGRRSSAQPPTEPACLSFRLPPLSVQQLNKSGSWHKHSV